MPWLSMLMLAFTALASPPAWHDPAAWTALEPGQSAFDVQRFLGRPAVTQSLPNGSEVWHYQLDADGTASKERGLVVLKPVGSGPRPVLRVARIKLPDFDAIPAPEPQPVPPAPAPVLPAIRPAPAPVRPPVPEPMTLVRQEAPSPANPPSAVSPAKKPAKDTNVLGKYFTFLGIGSIVISLIIAFIKPISEHFG
jgi:hypothetical protein